MSRSSKVAVQLSALREQFLAKLPAKLQEIEAAVAVARIDSAGLGNARSLAHRLRGVAGSYGQSALGDAVGCAEDLLGAGEEHPEVMRASFWQDVDNALQDARVCLARATESELSDPDLADSSVTEGAA